MRAGFITLLALGWTGGTWAIDDHSEQLRRLDERVQAIKAEALELQSAIQQAEEAWLYPPAQRTRIFVTMDVFEFELRRIDLSIDGQSLTAHDYSPRDVYALRRGGVQELFLGNVAPGSHALSIDFSGRFEDDADNAAPFEKTIETTFTKRRSPARLEVRIEPRRGRRDIEVRVFEREVGE